MTTGSEFEVHPEELRAVVGNVTHTLLSLYSVIQEVSSLNLTGATYGMIGAPVSAGDIAMKAETARTLLSILRLFKQINDAAHQVANAYQSADHAVATSFGGQPGTTSFGANPIPAWAHTNPNGYASWLSQAGDAGVGMVNVYSATTDPSSVHGRLMPGDVMVVEPAGGGDAQIFVMGSDGRLHDGATAPNGQANVRIYRSVGDSTVLW